MSSYLKTLYPNSLGPMKCGRAPPLPGLEELWGAGIRGSLEDGARWEPSLGTEGLALRGTGFQRVSARKARLRHRRRRFASQAEMPVSLRHFFASNLKTLHRVCARATC